MRYKTKSPDVPRGPDIIVEDHGSLVLLRPVTVRAERWIAENVQDDAMYWCGALVVEPRYVEPLILGMRTEGMVIQ